MIKISTPLFWKKKFHLLTIIFLPLSIIYFFLILLNRLNNIFSKKISIKIICVGNLYVGGTGKTPLVKKIFNDLKKNKKICVIKKYRKNHRDEINLLKKDTVLFVVKKRIDGLRKAVKKKFNTAIIDDGMQDYSFNKDFPILCIKSKHAFGNGNILPAGPLREPLSSIKNYKIAVINGKKNNKINIILKKYNPNIKIFYSNYYIKNLNELKNKKFLAFSGIADNESFFNILKKNNIEIVETKCFNDHHDFTDEDMQNLIKKSQKKNIKLVTTDKNYNNLNSKFKKKIFYTKIDLEISNYSELLNEIN